jgi:branched-subunit amino acid transport protein
MDDAVYIVIVSIGMFFVTLATRASFFMLPSRFQLPTRLEQALRYAPACALIGIITPGIFTNKGGSLNLDFTNPRLWGVCVAALVFAKTRNMMVMMTIGMGVFTLIRLTS